MLYGRFRLGSLFLLGVSLNCSSWCFVELSAGRGTVTVTVDRDSRSVSGIRLVQLVSAELYVCSGSYLVAPVGLAWRCSETSSSAAGVSLAGAQLIPSH